MAMFPQWNDPGATAVVETGEWNGILNAFGREMLLITQSGTIKSSSTDSGNTPTTTLRAGMVLAIKESDGLYYPYAANATDGTQNAVAVLPVQLNMLNQAGVAANKTGPLITRANLRVSELVGSDVQALKALIGRGFIFDAPAGAQGLSGPAATKYVDGATVTAAQNGTIFVAAGAATFTLPTIAVGLSYEFYQTADANLAISSAGSLDDIIAFGDATADTVTFSTASQKIGSHARLTARYNAAGALRWFFSNLGGTTATVT